MARPLRIEYEGAFYHVLSRGHRKEKIYFSDKDKQKFLEKLSDTVEKYLIIIHAYALMDNHYHLLIETPKANISDAMHHLNASYSNWLKAKYKLVGSIFQGRYKSILIDKENYLNVLSAYIHLNPVRSKIGGHPRDFKWSSYRSYVGLDDKPPWLTIYNILADFNGDRDSYSNFVLDWYRNETEMKRSELYGKNSILGSEKFIKNISNMLRKEFRDKIDREMPELKQMKELSSDEIKAVIMEEFKIDEIKIFRKNRGNPYRKLFVYGLKKYSDMSLKRIGLLMKMDYAAVSEMARRFKRESERIIKLSHLRQKFDERIKNIKQGKPNR